MIESGVAGWLGHGVEWDINIVAVAYLIELDVRDLLMLDIFGVVGNHKAG